MRKSAMCRTKCVIILRDVRGYLQHRKKNGEGVQEGSGVRTFINNLRFRFRIRLRILRFWFGKRNEYPISHTRFRGRSPIPQIKGKKDFWGNFAESRKNCGKILWKLGNRKDNIMKKCYCRIWLCRRSQIPHNLR